ncbi:enoyl-CoA hydratase PHS1 Ecym_6346 [Eremothecium cymbalariae DBVPG|uniref:Very-long-chain (3R)-3-hydroxyacyl-CoA dehydratase n=1 Tax=Eremothecium cymbalariae (strain CBS 270.75 / DBVPG 7215 / KCTC 17166 / NRRL Y-17582) TaxID=931890 RepID=G8JUE2_ERECY|nr:hypothetical protein Ecym_6346 [Eremothecium cymbalariae DBVPG\
MSVNSKYHPLALYNLISCLAWLFLLYNVVFVYRRVSQPEFYMKTKDITTLIQCGSIIEVFNAVFGIVRAPIFTTAAQVASRLVLVIGIFQLVPETPAAQEIPYVTLLFAWSLTEVVRYLFYYCNLVNKQNGPPRLLIFLRYNLFWVLYPLGVISELLIINSSTAHAADRYGVLYKFILYFIMLTYIPMFPTLYLHVMSQRSKVMKTLKMRNQKSS